ncbi:phytanoyl-CoA dioxygenase family protein [Brevundimonas sp. MF30-B]|nr:phytanoyl-CoA dioxygenase family protein [Brevundimonas sp. MF30-B]
MMMAFDAQEALDALNTDGFVVVDSDMAVLADAAVAEFRAIEAEHPDLFKREPDGRYPRLINFHLASPALRRIFTDNERALAVQDAFFGEPSSLYTTLFYEKGSAQDLHRDTPYFTTRPEHRYLGVWTALEDVDEENGPLMVMRGGHLMPEEHREAIAAEVFPDGDIPHSSDELWVRYQDKVAASGRERGLKIETVPVKKGDTIIWHPQLPHGGSVIRDPQRTRLSLVQHVTPLNAQVYGLDAFFNPNKTLPSEAGWSYETSNGRSYIDHGVVGIGHMTNVPRITFPQGMVPQSEVRPALSH